MALSLPRTNSQRREHDLASRETQVRRWGSVSLAPPGWQRGQETPALVAVVVVRGVLATTAAVA